MVEVKKIDDLLDDSCEIYIYRDDQNHAQVSGNKLHKLMPNMEAVKINGCNTVLSFGGLYSNHLHALAYVSKQQGLKSIGFVRGELNKELPPTLKDCQAWGMKLLPMQRKAYRDVLTHIEISGGGLAKAVLQNVDLDMKISDNVWVIPEGGSNLLAIQSLTKAYAPLFEGQGFTYTVCATGTGATVAGLYQAAPSDVKVIGIQAVAEGEATKKRIQSWLGNDVKNLAIVEGHCGGFAKMPQELLEFIEAFERKHDVPLDPVYNGKVMFKLMQMEEEGFFSQRDKVLVIHTGGLQGKRGLSV